jgi:hypothetical protein
VRTIGTIAFVLALSISSASASEETKATSKIVRVDLFKNGLAVVRREVALGKPGVYVLDDVPNPVHGTFWVEAAGPIETSVRTRDVEVPASEILPGNLQDDLAGTKVTIQFKGAKLPPVSGTIVKFKKAEREDAIANPTRASAQPNRFVVLQTGKGRLLVDSSEIAAVETDGSEPKATRRQTRLLLKLLEADKPETRVHISYLAHGLGWAPAYKVDISDSKTLVLEQQAVLKNELADLDGAEINLISGFPSVQFANVTSPLSARTSWATFIAELNQRMPRYADQLGNVTLQQAVYLNAAPFNVSPVAVPAGEGVDLHYQSIGKRTLAEGDALSLSVARGKADYERIVEWLIPDGRDEWGRHVQGNDRSDDADDTAWDALRFKNPLPYPMTTGAAMVTAKGRFNGQRTTYWANAGEETVLRVDKALSVRTRSLEHEERKTPDDNRDLVWIGGRQYRKAIVEAELAVSNHRAETVQLIIRRRFSGELEHADGEPKVTLREEGAYSVNRRSELHWSLSLKPGEDRLVKYRYSLLVAH